DAPDAAVAAALARARNAPVVLTERDRLTPAVARFIVRNVIREVVVVGGPAAVPAAVLDEIAAAADVTRVAGADRVATAVAVARLTGEPGEFCETAQVSVVLVGADSPADAAVAGPLSYRARLPILYAGPDALAPEVADYLA
ncbi:MAG TPA: hypothetical protein DEP66_03860, partial [Acidimicrobiaceae bacterium]|nr:hypothetical protein [Acidimicrobiaceae bacterium]